MSASLRPRRSCNFRHDNEASPNSQRRAQQRYSYSLGAPVVSGASEVTCRSTWVAPFMGPRTPRAGACSMSWHVSYILWALIVFVALCLSLDGPCYVVPTVRYGEAKNPGPSVFDPCGFDREDYDEDWDGFGVLGNPPFFAESPPLPPSPPFPSQGAPIRRLPCQFDNPYFEDGNWDEDGFDDGDDNLASGAAWCLDRDRSHEAAADLLSASDPCDGKCGSFHAAKKFMGQKCHRVFKLGTHGLGYYPDCIPRRTLLLETLVSLPPRQVIVSHAVVFLIEPLLTRAVAEESVGQPEGSSSSASNALF